jgi:hypothetical protein
MEQAQRYVTRQTAIWLAVLVLSVALLTWQFVSALAYVTEWPAQVVDGDVPAFSGTFAPSGADTGGTGPIVTGGASPD